MNAGKYFLGENYFNYTAQSNIAINVTDPKETLIKVDTNTRQGLKYGLFVLVIVTVLLCLIGWCVEYTRWGNKPNFDESEEFMLKNDDSVLLQQDQTELEKDSDYS